MTNFEKIKNMNTDEFADWLLENGQQDAGIWDKWYTDKYCSKCEAVIYHSENWGDQEACFCEMNKYCKFFPDNKNYFDAKRTIKMWLESEVK